MKPFIVIPSNYDTTRPWAVIATFRSFGKTVKRYENRAVAKRHAAYLNKRGTPTASAELKRAA